MKAENVVNVAVDGDMVVTTRQTMCFRFIDGILHQKYTVEEWKSSTESAHRDEWREVPHYVDGKCVSKPGNLAE